MKKVYLLEHTIVYPDGREDTKNIGIYSAEERAKEAIERLRRKPGFKKPMAISSLAPICSTTTTGPMGSASTNRRCIRQAKRRQLPRPGRRQHARKRL